MKITTYLLCSLSLVLLIGCGGGDSDSSSSETSPVADADSDAKTLPPAVTPRGPAPITGDGVSVAEVESGTGQTNPTTPPGPGNPGAGTNNPGLGTEPDGQGTGATVRLTNEQIIELRDSAGEDFNTGHISNAENKLKFVLEQLPAERLDQGDMRTIFVSAHMGLAEILSFEGRTIEAQTHLLELLKQWFYHSTEMQLKHLMFLDGSNLEIEPNFLAIAEQGDRTDPMPLFIKAKEFTRQNNVDQAETFLKVILDKYPDFIEGHALKGHVLVEQDNAKEYANWNQQLPAGAEDLAEIWVVRGRWAAAHGQPKVATRCFWEAARRDPNHQVAHFQLALMLNAIGQPEVAAPFMKRSKLLLDYQQSVYTMYRQGAVEDLVVPAAAAAESLGRLWEAWAWNSVMVARGYDAAQARQRRDRIKDQLLKERPDDMTLVSAGVAEKVELSDQPLPDLNNLGSREIVQETTKPKMQFNDVAKEAGIDFTFFEDSNPETPGLRMFELYGGGVAVLDYDGDGWADLYFTQGSEYPSIGNPNYADRLYRNLGNGKFEDVTANAGLGDRSYSQGVAAGDIDNDGFTDLYVANIGENRLYLNNGDGTFTDTDLLNGLDRKVWSTCVVIADLNGDSYPDLYDGNYIGGTVLTDYCGSQINVECAPSYYKGEKDQLYVSTGNLTFKEMSEDAGLTSVEGKALGLIVADFDGQGQLSLFVGNDADANNWLVNQSESPHELKYSDLATISGLAFDYDGRFQGCMGIAFDDANGNGKFDMFITNFANDSNTLYMQKFPNLFDDSTRQAGLRDASFSQLGFGAQFFDADLDGKPDIVLVNGHIDDYTEAGQEYEMLPQIFHNAGDGKFDELIDEVSGDFFKKKFLGRSLALIDFDRDGKEDFAVSNLKSPVALVANQTEKTGNSVSINLRGVSGARDAIGAIVTMKYGDQIRTRQLHAGDGYQASNQRHLVVGLGDAQQIDELTIRWPLGETQTLRALAANREYVIVEGEAAVEKVK